VRPWLMGQTVKRKGGQAGSEREHAERDGRNRCGLPRPQDCAHRDAPFRRLAFDEPTLGPPRSGIVTDLARA
jgi:hypothetical protein